MSVSRIGPTPTASISADRRNQLTWAAVKEVYEARQAITEAWGAVDPLSIIVELVQDRVDERQMLILEHRRNRS